MIRRRTLEESLDPALHPQIVKFKWSAIRTGKGKPYVRDPTVQRLLDKTKLDPHANYICTFRGRIYTDSTALANVDVYVVFAFSNTSTRLAASDLFFFIGLSRSFS